jgi:DNA-binding beta-propeller fold protein YncE
VPSPKGVAFSPDGEEIWVTSLTNKQTGVYVFNSLTGEEKARIQLPDGGGVEVIFNQDGTRAYISQMETARVFEIDSFEKEIVRVFETKSSWTKVLFLSSDGSQLYASNWVDDNVSVFNLNTGELLDNLPSPDTPRGIYVTKDNTILYVAGFGEGTLQEINLTTEGNKVVYESGGALRHIVGDEARGFLFISDMAKNKIWQFDMETKKTTIFAETDVNPNTITLSPDKNILFVSNRGENYSLTDYSRPGPEWGSILLFDVNTGLLLDAILGGNQPTGLDISPDGRRLVFSNFLDHNIEIYQIPDYSVLVAGNGGAGNNYKASLKK